MESRLLILWLAPLFVCLFWSYLIYKSPTVAKLTNVYKENQLFLGVTIALIPIIGALFVIAVAIVVAINTFETYKLELLFDRFKGKWLNKDHLG